MPTVFCYGRDSSMVRALAIRRCVRPVTAYFSRESRRTRPDPISISQELIRASFNDEVMKSLTKSVLGQLGTSEHPGLAILRPYPRRYFAGSFSSNPYLPFRYDPRRIPTNHSFPAFQPFCLCTAVLSRVSRRAAGEMASTLAWMALRATV